MPLFRAALLAGCLAAVAALSPLHAAPAQAHKLTCKSAKAGTKRACARHARRHRRRHRLRAHAAAVGTPVSAYGPYAQSLRRPAGGSLLGNPIFRENAAATKGVLAVRDSSGAEVGVRYYATPAEWLWAREQIAATYPGCTVPAAPKATARYDNTTSASGRLRWRAAASTERSLEVIDSRDRILGGRISGGSGFWCWVKARVDARYGASTPTPEPTPEPTPSPTPSDAGCDSRQDGWRPPSRSFVPLSDAEAAALVCDSPEQRADNGDENARRPTQVELDATIGSERNRYGQLIGEWNPLARYVTGNFSGSTDDILEWAANKWGIPEDWVRAQAQNESNWHMSQLGDNTLVGSSANYPAYSRIDGTHVYQSLGIMQVRWNHPDKNSAGIGAEALRWRSTAFNVDYTYAQIRYYYDGLCTWCGSAYSAGQEWASIGGWYNPSNWPSGSATYQQHVQEKLAARAWQQTGF